MVHRFEEKIKSMKISETREALFVGINNYPGEHKLGACEADAKEMSKLLSRHDKGDPNFPSTLKLNLTNEHLRNRLEELFSYEVNHLLFYFSGHGTLNEDGGYLVGRNFTDDDPGVSMSDLVKMVNRSKSEEITIILDCCKSGHFANLDTSDQELATLRKNVTILSASTQKGNAKEGFKHGFFTRILLNGLRGAAADVAGHVTSFGLYNLADSLLLPRDEQRPVFKSFITQLSPLRYCYPRVRKRDLRKIIHPQYFENRNEVLELKPEIIITKIATEGDRAFFSDLINFYNAGLIECPDRMNLYEATLAGKSCKLSEFGQFFWEMNMKNNF